MDGEFWSVFKNSRNAMLLMDDARRYVDANEAALRLLGLRYEEAVGLPIAALVPPERLADLESRWANFIERGSHHGFYPFVLPNGRRLEVEYSATANVLPGRHLAILLERDGDIAPREALTQRERDVVRAVAEGATTQEIAARLYIAPTTVDTHVRKAMLRLGAKNRAHLIALALQRHEI